MMQPELSYLIESFKRYSEDVIKDHNPNHSGRTGRFSDGTDSGSWSLDGKQHKRRGKKKKASTAPCGRKRSPSTGSKHRCRDNSIKEADIDLDPKIDAAYLKAVVKDAVKDAVTAAMKTANANVQKKTGCTLQYCLRVVNDLNAAEDGDLYDKK